jgi:hypothetical protein
LSWHKGWPGLTSQALRPGLFSERLPVAAAVSEKPIRHTVVRDG